MGACFSQDQWIGVVSDGDFSTRAAPTAKVISSSGLLHEYAVPVTVSKVLEAEISSASSSSRTTALFLCNSDSLCYEELIPEMASDEQLAKDQIYFSLPRSRLGRPLSASDMAALAVKASLALQNGGRSRIGRKSQISPVLEVSNSLSAVDSNTFVKPLPAQVPPARKYRRSSSSRRLKRAVRSFRIRLTTIQEGPESVHLDQQCRN